MHCIALDLIYFYRAHASSSRSCLEVVRAQISYWRLSYIVIILSFKVTECLLILIRNKTKIVRQKQNKNSRKDTVTRLRREFTQWLSKDLARWKTGLTTVGCRISRRYKSLITVVPEGAWFHSLLISTLLFQNLQNANLRRSWSWSCGV